VVGCASGNGRHAVNALTTSRRILLTSLSGQLGGLELRLADEARLLKAHGHRPQLAISPFPGADAWFGDLQSEGLELASFDPPPFFEQWRWRRFNLLRARLLHQRRLQAIKPDLMHVAYAWTDTGGSRLWLSDSCGIPTVISVHNAFPRSELSPWGQRLMRRAFRSVRGIYGVSESALRQFLDIYGTFVREQTITETVHNFVDVDRFKPDPAARVRTRARLGIALDAVVVGSIGRVDAQKEPLAVARCFAAATREMPHAVLVYVGQGPLAAELQAELVQLDIEQKVRRVDFQSDPENYFPALDVHVLLSRQEGFGITTAEAMACGVPVLATNVPGTRDVLADTGAGWLVPYLDEAAVATAFRQALSDPAQRVAMGRCGVAVARQRFAKPLWENKLLDFYGRVFDHTHGNP
jgi:glycosyltransferase involved in cell wall biosynthesis